MSGTLVIKFGPGGHDIQQAGLVAEGRWLQGVPLDDLASCGAGQAVVVISGTNVTCWRQALPDFPAAKLRKVLPNLMEDMLADRAAEQHFACWPVGEGSEKLVAVIRDEVMAGVMATCRELGVEPVKLIPDFMLVGPAEQPVLVTEGDLALARLPDGTGFTSELALAKQMLDGDAYTDQKSEVGALLARAPESAHSLLQGQYAPKADFSKIWLLIKRPSFLCAALILLWFGSLYGESVRFDSQAGALRADTEKLFRQAFPKVSRVVNVEAQARQQLAMLRQSGGGEFLRISTTIFAAVEETRDALPRYVDGRGCFTDSALFCFGAAIAGLSSCQ